MMEDTAIVATDRMFHGITAYPSKYDYNYEYSHTHHTNNATQRALYTPIFATSHEFPRPDIDRLQLCLIVAYNISR